MNKTVQALLLKFGMTLIASWIAFSFINENTFTNILIVALLGTFFNYLLGDLITLPKFGNIIASVGDGLLGSLTAYIYSLIIPNFTTTFTSLLLFGFIILIAEYFFHQYLLKTKKVLPNES